MPDEFPDFVVGHDGCGMFANRVCELVFLFDPPAQDRLETRRSQKHQRIEVRKQFRVVIAKALVDVAAPAAIRILVCLEFVDGRIEIRVRLRDATDAPAFQDDKVDGSRDCRPRGPVGALVSRFVETRQAALFAPAEAT